MRYSLTTLILVCWAMVSYAGPPGAERDDSKDGQASAVRSAQMHRETPHDPWMPPPAEPPPGVNTGRGVWSRGSFVSIQVNVDAFGNNIPGDAANEPSIAVDPTDPNKIVIGWRQFDSVLSNFRQAGWGYSHNGGQTWTFPGVIDPGVFRSDPVLDANAQGDFFYNSLTATAGLAEFWCNVYKSTDGGMSWDAGVYAYGGDKQWMTIDRTGGIGHDNIYANWTKWYTCPGCDGHFTRSYDGGATFLPTINLPGYPLWGTLAVGPDGELYVSGDGFTIAKSSTIQDESLPVAWDVSTTVSLDGSIMYGGGPNPGGLLGQVWIAVDGSDGPTHGNVYLLCSVERSSTPDPLDVMFARSTNGGATWSDPVRVNDDPDDWNYQWFGTMSVAPNGRIDAIWNDTRNTGQVNLSELYYAFSTDEGLTWTENIPISPVFDSYVGWPQQNKLGDYYDMISFDHGASIAYAATFNGEQDVYYLWLSVDCNDNGIFDPNEISDGSAEDCNGNNVPDECEPDFDGDGVINGCDDDIDDDGVLNESDMCDFTPLGTPVSPRGRSLSDTNGNCEVDLIDHERFTMCLLEGGPAINAPSQSCVDFFDYDLDDDTDLADFAHFQTLFTQR